MQLNIKQLFIGNLLLIGLLIFISGADSQAQENNYKSNYIGLLPSVLFEPYDAVDAVEINTVPIVYEYRFNKSVGFQVRPLLNYRFHEVQKGISQVGMTVLFNKYLNSVFEPEFFMVPVISGYYTYAFNRLDRIHAMTLGAEPGIVFRILPNVTINISLQPGINYYPDDFSREFVGTETGFKSHFGVIFHIGYHF